eukprot:274998-Hanusia_phi.AAC.1
MKRRRVVVTVVTRNGLRITGHCPMVSPPRAAGRPRPRHECCSVTRPGRAADWPLIACRRTTRPVSRRYRTRPLATSAARHCTQTQASERSAAARTVRYKSDRTAAVTVIGPGSDR